MPLRLWRMFYATTVVTFSQECLGKVLYHVSANSTTPAGPVKYALAVLRVLQLNAINYDWSDMSKYKKYESFSVNIGYEPISKGALL